MEITAIISILISSCFISYCMCNYWQCNCGRSNYDTCSNTNCLNTAKQIIGSRGTVTVPYRGDRLTIICNINTESYVMPNNIQCNVCTDEVFPNIFIPTCVPPTSASGNTSSSLTLPKNEEVTFSTPRNISNLADSTVQEHYESITKQDIGLIIMAVILLVFIISTIVLASKRCVNDRNTQVEEKDVYDYAMVDFNQAGPNKCNRGTLDSSENGHQNYCNNRPMLPIPSLIITNEEYEEPKDAMSVTPYVVPVS